MSDVEYSIIFKNLTFMQANKIFVQVVLSQIDCIELHTDTSSEFFENDFVKTRESCLKVKNKIHWGLKAFGNNRTTMERGFFDTSMLTFPL